MVTDRPGPPTRDSELGLPRPSLGRPSRPPASQSRVIANRPNAARHFTTGPSLPTTSPSPPTGRPLLTLPYLSPPTARPLLTLPYPPRVPVVPCKFLGPLQVGKVAENGGGNALRGTKAPLRHRGACRGRREKGLDTMAPPKRRTRTGSCEHPQPEVAAVTYGCRRPLRLPPSAKVAAVTYGCRRPLGLPPSAKVAAVPCEFRATVRDTGNRRDGLGAG